MKPFLVETIGKTLKVLVKLNLFQYIIKKLGVDNETRGALTELWILLNLLLSILLLVFFNVDSCIYLKYVVIFYSYWRIGEVLVFQIYSQIFGGYPGKKTPRLNYSVLSYRRSIFLAIILLVEAIFWFGVLYKINYTLFNFTDISLSNPIKALYYSFVTMSTIGYGDIYPRASFGFIIVITQCVTSIIMIILILSRIITNLPKPYTLDKTEEPKDQEEE